MIGARYSVSIVQHDLVYDQIGARRPVSIFDSSTGTQTRTLLFISRFFNAIHVLQRLARRSIQTFNRFRVAFQWLSSADHGASKIFNVLPNPGVRLQARVLRNKPSDDSCIERASLPLGLARRLMLCSTVSSTAFKCLCSHLEEKDARKSHSIRRPS